MKYKYLFLTLGVGFLFGILPVVIMYIAHGFYPKVPLEIADDTLYYLTRIREVLNHHYFIGNPYLLEHVHDTTTAFFVGDWIYSIPFFIGYFLKLSLVWIFSFSEVFWSLVTAYALYALYSVLGTEKKRIPWAVAVSMLSVLLYVWRPVGMSVVYPAFIFFLISLYRWIKKPEGKIEEFLLIVSSSLSFYVYTYLWQVVLVTLGFLFVFVLYEKKYRVRFVTILGLIGVISVPVFVYTWIQLHSAYYFETLARVGLIQTHTVGFVALLYASVVCIALYCLCTIFPRLEYRNEVTFFGVVFFALLVTGLSNVLSGKDLEVAVHIGRFTELFVSIFLIFFVSIDQKQVQKGVRVATLAVFIFVCYLVYVNCTIVTRVLSMREDNEPYAQILTALNIEPNQPFVVFSDDELASYIPVMTKNYVLFHPDAEVYLASNYEIEERYLVSRLFSNLTEKQLKDDFRKYGGVGNAVHEANSINRKVKVCVFVKSIVHSLSCPALVTSYSLKGEGYFQELMSRYAYIQKHPEEYLDMYHVKYIIFDREKDTVSSVSVKNFHLFAHTSRFIILKRN